MTISTVLGYSINNEHFIFQVMRSSDCPYIVKFYGALFWEGDCWICMELMSTSLDKFYRFVYHRRSDRIPEDILGKIAVATVKALDYLKVNVLSIILILEATFTAQCAVSTCHGVKLKTLGSLKFYFVKS